MRLWRNVKSMDEVVEITNILMRNNIRFFMEHNGSTSWNNRDTITIVIQSRSKNKIEKCKEIGFIID